MLDRPLIFNSDCPTIIVVQNQAERLKHTFAARHLRYNAEPFFTFERIRFPGHSMQDVESLFDYLDREEKLQHA